MPISTSSFGDQRDGQYDEYEREEYFDQETLEFPGLDPAEAENLLKRLGGGVAQKLKVVEGIGWKATITATDDGVAVEFDAHDELLDDLLRRFEEMVDRVLG
ncbi:MAG: hypothetical protein HC802_01295 [Caldilineaceae bacterium]|nr:hypothetical protein [Caldilineaceae bacterium]